MELLLRVRNAGRQGGNVPVQMGIAQRAVPDGWLRRRTTSQALAQRSRILLKCAEGHSAMKVSRRLRIAPDTVRTWRRRFLERPGRAQ
ncbi:helix-turn-helix domain-containing protein [Streptomyces sp. NPDC053720]|uniref:helix-turn-helix domain-containing protein n=1 Tax=Streptomyces sp. NPDC053720 TaxID=3154855 RepID=UPI00341216A1